jgi:hypothetical protein
VLTQEAVEAMATDDVDGRNDFEGGQGASSPAS